MCANGGRRRMTRVRIGRSYKEVWEEIAVEWSMRLCGSESTRESELVTEALLVVAATL